LKEKVLRYLGDSSSFVDFQELVDSPGWEYINSFDIPTLDKFICLALSQAASSSQELKREAGLIGSKGRLPVLKTYWRKFAKTRLMKIPKYKAKYKEQLDDEWKINEALGYRELAEKCLAHVSEQDARAFYSKGKISIEHLRLRSRLTVLGLFMNDLRKKTETQKEST
jgi:hypothetical protein